MTERLLRVVAPHYVAGALWQFTSGSWRCIGSAPILHWMVGRDPEFVHSWLQRKGYDWSWH